jgi:hypothetical protein
MDALRPRTKPGPVAAKKDVPDLSSAGQPSVKPIPAVGTIWNPDRPIPCRDGCGYPLQFRWTGRAWQPWGPLDQPHAAQCPRRKRLDPTRCHREGCGSSDVEVSDPRPDVHPGGWLYCRTCKRGRWLPASEAGKT